MTLLIKIQYVFNKILLNLLKEIKNKDADLKKKIKENLRQYQSRDRS